MVSSKKINEDVTPEDSPGLALQAIRRIYLVRHGVTEWNQLFRYQGSTDIALSEEGIEQAERAGIRLSRLMVKRIITSPQRRAVDTALSIAKQVGVKDIEKWDDLREVSFGEWEGLTVPEIIAAFGQELFDAWRKAQLEVTAPGGEDAHSVRDRSKRAAQKLSALNDKVTVVVSHGAIFRSLILHLLDVPLSSVFWKMRIDNCSISAVEFDGRGRCSVSFLNDTTHLQTSREKIHSIPLK